ncbi:protein kinase domain-containing protein, partial [Magnaporthiopsis poae ATCC 64411]
MWWDQSRIQATVTRQFVCSHLHPEDAGRLDWAVSFGGGLTDGTYWEWIDGKAKRIFLILLDLGIPRHIFALIDGSWDDSDLPIALDQVRRLGLTGPARDGCEFYSRQFYYLLRPLRKGNHIVYSESEIVPLDLVDRRTGLTQGSGSGGGGSGSGNSSSSVGGGQTVDRVTLPGDPNHVFYRRRIPIGSGPGCLAHEDFQDEASRVRNIYNEHLVSYFASYVQHGYGYVLFTPASDASLKTMLTGTLSSVKALDKQARRELVMNWIHCLVDTLCYIHSRGLSHGNIRPSKVLLNSTDNHISFSDFTRFDAELLLLAGAASDQGRGGFDKEA